MTSCTATWSRCQLKNVSEMWFSCLHRSTDHFSEKMLVDFGLYPLSYPLFFSSLMPLWARITQLLSTGWMTRDIYCRNGNISVLYHDRSNSRNHPVLDLCRVSQEERSVFWEVMIMDILSKNCAYTCVLFRTVSEIELFHWTLPKLLKRKRYYVLFLIPVFIAQVTKLV
jgi:hypothetical protein